MKNLLYVFLMLTIGLPFTTFAQNQVEAIEKIKTYQKVVKEKLTENQFNFNSPNWQIDSMRFSENNGSSYPVTALIEYVYDANNVQVGIINYDYDTTNNTIARTTKTDYIMFNDSLIDESIRYELENGNWKTISKIDYVYATDTTEVNFLDWNDSLSTWILSFRMIDVKNANNQVIENYTFFPGFSFKTTRSYNANNQLIETLEYFLDTTSASWVHSVKSEFIYNALGLRTEVIRYIYVFSYNLFQKENYTYNADNQVVLTEFFNYDVAAMTWIPNSNIIQEYDAFGNHIKTKYSLYTNDNIWFENRMTEIFYSDNSVATNQIKENIQLTYYPNPASDFVNIELEEALKQSVGQVFDVNGKLLKQRNFNNNLEQINISDLPNGNYFLKISNETHQATLKILKQ